MSAVVNPLANSKEGKRLCELCQNPAHVQCDKCRVTFYCDEAHQQADWKSIHYKVCQLLIPVRTPAPFHTLQAARDHYRMQTRKRLEHLMAFSRTEARGWVLEGRYEDAIPAALLSLHCAMKAYGPDAIELVPAYLLLAEANLGLEAFSQAECFLSKAEWGVQKVPNCSLTVLYQLHRTSGRLHTARKNYPSALLHFAYDVYYASVEFGLDSVITAGGYFLMANVFLKQEKPVISSSLYSEVVGIWYAYLSKLMEHLCQSGHQSEPCLDRLQCIEAEQMLFVILDVQQQGSNSQNAKLWYSLATLRFLCNDHEKALDFGKRAAEFSQQCEPKSLTDSIHILIHQAKIQLNNKPKSDVQQQGIPDSTTS